jgi:hypothetical protein
MFTIDENRVSDVLLTAFCILGDVDDPATHSRGEGTIVGLIWVFIGRIGVKDLIWVGKKEGSSE